MGQVTPLFLSNDVKNATALKIKTLSDSQTLAATLSPTKPFVPTHVIFSLASPAAANGDCHIDIGTTGLSSTDIVSDLTLTGLDADGENFVHAIDDGVMPQILSTTTITATVSTQDSGATAGDLTIYLLGSYIDPV